MKQKVWRIGALMLALSMVISMIPMSALAAVDYEMRTDDYYKVISKQDWELAPGIEESEIVLNNDAGNHRQVAHVVEIDPHNEYTKVIPSYKGMIPEHGKYGTQIMSEQAAYAEANGYGNVVAAMNLSLSWYDGNTGDVYYHQHPEYIYEPLGYMVLDGVKYQNSQGQTGGAKTVLIINYDEKDGVTRPADIPKTQIRSTADPLTGWEESAIPANFDFLVKNGKNQYSKNHSSDPASRSFVGVKADGTIVMVMNDGRQSPYSAGFTNYEMAEFMLSLGCVHATNGDGGGSSAFLSERPGEELKLNCSPSDGAERETTHGILVISTAPATGEFVRATISSEYDYYTPGSQVTFSAIGSDLVGTAADIPAEAEWKLADPSFGTIENGVFTSTGKQGAVVVQIVYNGEVVGEDTIYVVMPDKIAFAQENMVVPYGKTVKMVINATYDSKTVCIKPADVKFTLSDAKLGTLNDFDFLAAPEGTVVEPGTITATIGELTVTANLSLGKGSDIVYDFEDQNLTGWSIYTNYGKYGPVGPNGKVTDANGNYWYHGQNERGYISIVDKNSGQVRNGNYALKMECDFSQPYETGYHALNLMFPTIDTTDALKVGFWLYVPYDARHAQLIIAGGGFDNGELFNLCEGWHYVTAVPRADKTFSFVNISIDDRACATTGSYYNYITEANLNGKYTFYIDDITIDYSTAVEDRENPVFSATKVLNASGEVSNVMAGQTIAYNNPAFEVQVADFKADNAVGLNAATATAYIDGKQVDCTFVNGKITVKNTVLSDGKHTVKFAISDNNGNSSWVDGDIVVKAGTQSSTVKVVAQRPISRLFSGQLYWSDVVASNIETIEKVEMVFDLNNASYWELEGMTVADGFTASYSIQEDDNVATILIERTGESKATGEAVLASFPVRAWESHITEYEGYENQTPATLVKRGIIWKQSIELVLERGVITYVDSYTDATIGTFGMNDVLVETEQFFTNYTRASVTGAQAWINACKAAGIGFHEHTAKAADVAPTCTKDGYTGRTYCDVCESVVEWGTKVPATGHTYAFVGGVLKCTCGELFNGVYTDGKTYVDGVVVANGWIGESYYIDGVKLVGLQLIDGKYYVFDENGICPNKYPHSGWYTDNKGDTRYLNAGIPMTGYQYIANVGQAYFDKDGLAFDGEVVISGETCIFDKGVFVTSTTADVLHAGIAGEDVLFILYADGTFILSGTGATYDYTTYSWKTRPWGRYGNEEGALAGKIKKVIVGKDITSIGVFTFMSCYNIGEVIFEEGSQLKEIKTQAFHYVTALRSVKLPETVTTLGFSAFGYCENLESVYMPEFIRSIQSTAFSNDTKVVLNVVKGSKAESFAQKYGVAYETRKPQYGPADPLPTDTVKVSGTCGENVTWTLYNSGKMVISGSGAMADYASYTKTPWKDYKNDVVSLKIGKDITEIGTYAFASFLSLTYVEFEEGSVLHTIDNNAFHYCHLLESVTLPDTVTLIGFSAFGYCAKLTDIYMPECAKTLYNDIFLQSNPNLVLNVVEDFTAHNYAVRNNLKFATRKAIAPNGEALPGETIIASGKAGDNATWTLYMSGKFIVDGTGALYSYTSHKSTPWTDVREEARIIRIGNGITEIGSHALSAFYNVKRVVFEEGSQLHTLRDHAFHYNSALKEIVLPESVYEIQGSALGYCLQMEKVYMPDGKRSIYATAFNGSNTDVLVLIVAEDSSAYRFAIRQGLNYEVQ